MIVIYDPIAGDIIQDGNIDENGKLDAWPRGFCDIVENLLFELL